jgi:hypothetical protein
MKPFNVTLVFYSGGSISISEEAQSYSDAAMCCYINYCANHLTEAKPLGAYVYGPGMTKTFRFIKKDGARIPKDCYESDIKPFMRANRDDECAGI